MLTTEFTEVFGGTPIMFRKGNQTARVALNAVFASRRAQGR